MLKSFHRQASKNAVKHRTDREQQKHDEDSDTFSERVLPEKIVDSEIKGDFEVEHLFVIAYTALYGCIYKLTNFAAHGRGADLC